MTTSVGSPPIAPATPRRRRWRLRWWTPLLLLLVASLIVTAIQTVRENRDADRDREPLRAAERAALAHGQRITTVTPEQSGRWTASNGLTEERLTLLVGPGNHFLSAAFYADNDAPRELGLGDVSGQRCYFVAVQRGGAFDPERVSSIGRICFLGKIKQAYSLSFHSAVFF